MAASPEIVEVTPVPVATVSPGVLVRVQLPIAGRPFRITLPVAVTQVGWVIVPTVGAVGAAKIVAVTFSLAVLSQPIV